jgi:hypothetical protein
VRGEDFFAVWAEEEGRYLGWGTEGVEAGTGGCIPDVHRCIICAAS